MPFDIAIRETVESITGPLPNFNINTRLSAMGITEVMLADIWWAVEKRFDVNTNLEDLSIDMKVKDVWAYWKEKIAEDPDNNPEVA